MMKNSLYILFCMISMYACSDKEYMQRFADIKYTGETNPIQGIQTNGFYVEADKDSDNSVFIFYNDGTFVRTFLRYKLNSLMTTKPVNLNKAVQKWGRKSRHWGQSYGLYKIVKDTIYVTQYNRYAWYYDIAKYKYKIIDTENILLCFCEIPSLKQRERYLFENLNEKFTFVPADSIPSPDNGFLKKEKWYWENKSDWINYRRKKHQ